MNKDDYLGQNERGQCSWGPHTWFSLLIPDEFIADDINTSEIVATNANGPEMIQN
jgi:hypothetical protein